MLENALVDSKREITWLKRILQATKAVKGIAWSIRYAAQYSVGLQSRPWFWTVWRCRDSYCVLGDLHCYRNFKVTFPRSVPRHNPVSELYNSFDLVAWFLLWHALSFVGPAFPNHVQSIEFIIGGRQSSCINISRMINGNRMHVCSILGSHSKGSEYLCK